MPPIIVLPEVTGDVKKGRLRRGGGGAWPLGRWRAARPLSFPHLPVAGEGGDAGRAASTVANPGFGTFILHRALQCHGRGPDHPPDGFQDGRRGLFQCRVSLDGGREIYTKYIITYVNSKRADAVVHGLPCCTARSVSPRRTRFVTPSFCGIFWAFVE